MPLARLRAGDALSLIRPALFLVVVVTAQDTSLPAFMDESKNSTNYVGLAVPGFNAPDITTAAFWSNLWLEMM